MKRLRQILYLGHRYVGLAIAVFLTIAALTGSVLAFRESIERFVAPQLATGERLATLLRNPLPETGDASSYWFQKLHLSHSFGSVYGTFVAFLGLVIAMYAVTGIYLCWKKMRVRRSSKEGAKEGAVPLR
jgi:uncharacterized iron-regulated membrane protein